MAATDIPTQILTQLWTLINADGSWQIDPVNEVRYDQVVGTADPERDVLDDSDYPRCRIWLMSGANDMFFGNKTFATMSEDGPGNWVEHQRYIFSIEIISQLIGINEIDQEYIEVISALRAGGPTLGLNFVAKWGLTFRNEKVSIDVPNEETTRWRATITLTIDTEFEGSTL